MIGKRLKQLREANGWTQSDLAERINTDARQIWRWESGKTEPEAETLAKLALVFSVTSDFLLGLSNDPKPELSTSDLNLLERSVVSAIRRGDIREAIRAIVD